MVRRRKRVHGDPYPPSLVEEKIVFSMVYGHVPLQIFLSKAFRSQILAGKGLSGKEETRSRVGGRPLRSDFGAGSAHDMRGLIVPFLDFDACVYFAPDGRNCLQP